MPIRCYKSPAALSSSPSGSLDDLRSRRLFDPFSPAHSLLHAHSELRCSLLLHIHHHSNTPPATRRRPKLWPQPLLSPPTRALRTAVSGPRSPSPWSAVWVRAPSHLIYLLHPSSVPRTSSRIHRPHCLLPLRFPLPPRMQLQAHPPPFPFPLPHLPARSGDPWWSHLPRRLCRPLPLPALRARAA